MNSETRTCQNCKQEFGIEQGDFVFYKKMSVPAPTFCSACRLQRRLAFLNFIRLYKRHCDLCKSEFVTNYHPDAPYTVYCPACWWSDKWDAADYAQDYDFSRPFFEQFREFWKRVPVIGLAVDLPTVAQSPYNNYTGWLKDAYLLFHAGGDEDAGYGFFVFSSRSVYDCSLILQSEDCYDSMHAYKVSGGVGLASQVYESSDVAFLRDSRNCRNCVASANLANKEYYIFNESYTKEAYEEEMKKWDLGSYRSYQELKKRAHEHWKKYPPKVRFDEMTVDCTGNSVFQSKNCKDCYEVTKAEDSRYIFMTREVKDSYDISMLGEIERCYDGIVGGNAANVRFGFLCFEGAFDAEYSVLSHNGSTANFGCVSLRGRHYSIFNKQYSKEEYARITADIRKQMADMPYTDARGRVYRYGEFFPAELSPWGYNETFAQERFPLSEADARAQGFIWRDEPKTEYHIDRLASDMPDHIRDAEDSIVREVIGCAKCGRGFRIIPRELAFLRRRSLPLPRECPMCRIREKLGVWMAELKNIDGACHRCGSSVQYPSVSQGREILCKACYTKEIL